MTTAIVITVDEARTRFMNGQAIGYISRDERDDVQPWEMVSNPFRYMEIMIMCGGTPSHNRRVFKGITERAFIFYSVEGEGANSV